MWGQTKWCTAPKARYTLTSYHSDTRLDSFGRLWTSDWWTYLQIQTQFSVYRMASVKQLARVEDPGWLGWIRLDVFLICCLFDMRIEIEYM